MENKNNFDLQEAILWFWIFSIPYVCFAPKWFRKELFVYSAKYLCAFMFVVLVVFIIRDKRKKKHIQSEKKRED